MSASRMGRRLLCGRADYPEPGSHQPWSSFSWVAVRDSSTRASDRFVAASERLVGCPTLARRGRGHSVTAQQPSHTAVAATHSIRAKPGIVPKALGPLCSSVSAGRCDSWSTEGSMAKSGNPSALQCKQGCKQGKSTVPAKLQHAIAERSRDHPSSFAQGPLCSAALAFWQCRLSCAARLFKKRRSRDRRLCT